MKKLSFQLEPRAVMRTIGKAFAILCLLCIVIVLGIFLYVIGIRNELFDKAPDVFVWSLLIAIGVGAVSFGLTVASFVSMLFDFSSKKQNIILYILRLILIFSILPAYLILNILKSTFQKKPQKNNKSNTFIHSIISIVIILLALCPIWFGGYYLMFMMTKQILGYNPDSVSITGTGSMYPTFAKGEGKDPKELAKQIVGTPGMFPYPNGVVIAGKRYFGYEFGRGDIVALENQKIQEMNKSISGEMAGWVKRIIGIPGDTIELRDGIVYLNGAPLLEPYTAKPRSTFGESYLGECKKVTVPENNIFVMGDNRKGSGDSREIGFIEVNAINHILPLSKQIGNLDMTWRDTANDLKNDSKIVLDKEEYIRLLNEKRKEAGVREVKYQPKLDVSAQKRGEVILKYNDFSFEATKSGYTMSKAMNDAGYYNTLWGEAPTQGYYEAEELIDNQFQFPESKKFLLDKAYQEIGISEVEGEINGCPTQVIIQHFAGYVPPNYKNEDIESWKTSLSQLREVQLGWASLKNNESFYRDNKYDVDRINELINLRIANTSAIVSRMEANQWLTPSEQTMANQDKALYDEQQDIARRLNSK